MKKMKIQDKVFLITIYLGISLLLGYTISSNMKDTEEYSIINISLTLAASIVTLYLQYLIYSIIFKVINKKNLINSEKINIFMATILSLSSSNVMYIILLTVLRHNYYFILWFSVAFGVVIFILYSIKWFDSFKINKKILRLYFSLVIIINIIFTLLSM